MKGLISWAPLFVLHQLSTDESWRCTRGPTVFDSVYIGEASSHISPYYCPALCACVCTYRSTLTPTPFHPRPQTYDARVASKLAGWEQAGYDDSAWGKAQVVAGPAGRMEAPHMPSIRVAEELAPVSVTEPQPGVYVFDFGLNGAGVWMRELLRVDASCRLTCRDARLCDGRRDAADHAG
jgi:alpha-L-rhamnosidase